MMRRVIAMCVLVLVIVLGGGLASTAAAQGTVFLVRHAERADDANAGPKMTGTDPDLSGQGVLRAQALARALKDAKITAIYTTEFKRTRQTAAPLATALGVQVTEVSSKDLPGLFAEGSDGAWQRPGGRALEHGPGGHQRARRRRAREHRRNRVRQPVRGDQGDADSPPLLSRGPRQEAGAAG